MPLDRSRPDLKRMDCHGLHSTIRIRLVVRRGGGTSTSVACLCRCPQDGKRCEIPHLVKPDSSIPTKASPCAILEYKIRPPCSPPISNEHHHMCQWRIYAAPPALKAVDLVSSQQVEPPTKLEANHHMSPLWEKSYNFTKVHAIL